MTQSRTGLLFLLADFARQAALRERFQREPLAMLQEYGLSPDEVDLLRSRDPMKVEAALAAEAGRLLQEIHLYFTTTVWVPWPNPQVSISSCQPSSGPILIPVNFLITGMFFYGKCTLTFERPDQTFEATVIDSHCDDDGNSWLKATATFTGPGPYDVKVTVTAEEKQQYGILPAGFSAVAAP